MNISVHVVVSILKNKDKVGWDSIFGTWSEKAFLIK